jgi:NADPH:quinone reductase-like Zn-dependent oxidoreductase
MKAITILENHTAEIQEHPVPALQETRVLVQVKVVAVNPTDYKAIYQRGVAGSRSGCELVGIVQEVGSKVGKAYSPGDKIVGLVHGANAYNFEDGAFAEYANVKPDVSMKVPANLTSEEAVSIGVAITTVGQGLYKALGLPLPLSGDKWQGEPILIWGGSTSTGVMGIQYAKLSGLTVITTASPSNFEYMRSLGADQVFDYNSPTVSADIKEYTGNKLRYAWDCTEQGAEKCAAAMSDELPGKYGNIVLLPNNDILRQTNPMVEGPFWTLAYDALGEDGLYGKIVRSAKPDELEYARMFWGLSEKLLTEGLVKPIRVDVNRHGSGLEGVMKGIIDAKEGRVRGQKLVYTI